VPIVEQLGHDVCGVAIAVDEVADKIAGEDPDLSLVVLHKDDEHAIQLIDEISAYASGPVVALTQREDPDFVARAADVGISSFAKPDSPEAVQSAIELAVRVHTEREKLHEQVDQLEGALARRAVIERAKGMLMERHGIDDRDAFDELRAHARNNRRKVVDVARDVVDGKLELL
jgi:AmiR/NasT family two-component response regulator